MYICDLHWFMLSDNLCYESRSPRHQWKMSLVWMSRIIVLCLLLFSFYLGTHNYKIKSLTNYLGHLRLTYVIFGIFWTRPKLDIILIYNNLNTSEQMNQFGFLRPNVFMIKGVKLFKCDHYDLWSPLFPLLRLTNFPAQWPDLFIVLPRTVNGQFQFPSE